MYIQYAIKTEKNVGKTTQNNIGNVAGEEQTV